MSEEIKKELDKLNECVIVGSCYVPNKVFDTLSLQLEKNGKTFRFDVAFRRLLVLRTIHRLRRRQRNLDLSHTQPLLRLMLKRFERS